MIDQLRQLVSRYITGGIGYAPFRRELVSRFLVVSNQDADVRRVYRDVEIACAARDHGLITEAALKTELTVLIVPAVTLEIQGDIFEAVQQPATATVQHEWITRPSANTPRNLIAAHVATHALSLLVSEHDDEYELSDVA
jgi:hypothetical protein